MQSIDGKYPLSHHGAIAAGQECRRAANRRGGRAAEIIGSVGHLNALRGLFGRNDLLAAHSNSSPQFPASPAPRRAIVLACLATLI